MISLYNSQITDVIPDNLKQAAEVKALSYSIQKTNRKMLDYAKKVCIVSAIEELPEDILDLLAVELRTQYYASNIEIGIKRKLVKNTMLWYMAAGTAAAVEELVETVFGNGKVIEWFDFKDTNGEPGTFDIETGAIMTEDMINTFNFLIRNVKNTRSHLRKIYVMRKINHNFRIASGSTFHSKVVINNDLKVETTIVNSIFPVVGTKMASKIQIGQGG